MLKYDEAILSIDNYSFQNKTATVSPFNALDLVLARDVFSRVNVPNFRKSAMDGYALRKSDDLNTPFTVIDTIYAGDQLNPVINRNECVKIMTGAPIPEQADFVIVKELAMQSGNQVEFAIPPTKLNANICQIGEDIESEQLLFTAGTLITATMISSMVSAGVFEVEVYTKPQILALTTGDEVINTQQELNYGQIYNSNLAFLQSRLLELGFSCTTAHLTDNEAELIQHLDQDYDLIITTGAISVGDRDIMRNYLVKHQPKIIFDRVNIMPGGPCVFWEYQNTPVMSLAGSPFANFVTFELFARRIIAHLSGNDNLIIKEQQVKFNDEYSKKIKKLRFVKAHYANNQVTIPANNHLASSMHEMTMCNCLIRIERGDHHLCTNDTVTILDLRRTNE